MGLVYMAETNVGLFFYKQNILGLGDMASWSMFIYVGCMLGVVYLGVKHEVVFFKKENEGLVYMASKQGVVVNFGVRQEPCQVEEVLVGDVVKAAHGGTHHVD